MSDQQDQVKWRPSLHELLYFAFIFTLPIARPAAFHIGRMEVMIADFLFLFAFLTWLVAWIRGRTRLVIGTYMIPFAFWIVALVLSAAASSHLLRSAIKLPGSLYLVCAALLTMQLVRSMDALRRLTKFWLAATTVTVAAGLVGIVSFYLGFGTWMTNKFISYPGSVPAGPWPRVAGLFVFPNMTANYLSVSLSFAILALWLGWIPRKRGIALLAGIVVVEFFTLSPCFGGFLLALGIWWWLWLGSRRRWLGIAGLFGGVAGAAVFLFLTVVSAISDHPGGFPIPFTSIHGVMSHRFHTWLSAAATWSRHQILGRGLGLPVASVHYVTPTGHAEHLTDAHNLWLSIAAQMGTVGLLAMVILAVSLMKRIRFVPTKETSGRIFAAALTIAMIDAFAYQGLSGSFEDARHLWVLFGLIAVAPVIARSELTMESEPPGEPAEVPLESPVGT